jgi:hypothetical protein
MDTRATVILGISRTFSKRSASFRVCRTRRESSIFGAYRFSIFMRKTRAVGRREGWWLVRFRFLRVAGVAKSLFSYVRSERYQTLFSAI